jgi:threonine dehydrogenase-like Zn-dependent dehydrogenase
VPGAYVGMLDNIPFGAFMNKGLTMKTGQTHMQRYLKPLLKKILDGEIDPSKIISHRIKLDDAAEAYKIFNDKRINVSRWS